MRKTIGRAVRALALVLVLLICIQVLGVMFQDQSVCRHTYTAGENAAQTDVVCVGSSHAFCTVYPQYLYDEFGIAAWNMASRETGIPNMYWGVREIIDTAHPKVILAELMMMTEDPYLSEYARGSMVRDMPMFSLNHWRAFFDLNDGRLSWTSFFEFFFDHNQFANIGRESNLTLKHRDIPALNKGAGYLTAHKPFSRAELPVYSQVEPDRNAIPQENIEYLQKTIDYSEQNGVQLLFFIAPDPRPEMYAGKRAVVQLVQEMGYPVLDFNEENLQQQVGFDVEQHMADTNHINMQGALPINDYLGAYLMENYLLEDRLGQPGYDVWEARQQDYLWPERLAKMQQLTDAAEYLQAAAELPPQQYAVIAISEGDWNSTLEPPLRDALEAFGMQLPPDGSHFAFTRYNGEIWQGVKRDFRINGIGVRVNAEEAGLMVGNSDGTRMDSGITLVVMDVTTGGIVQNVVLKGEKAYH